MTISRSWVTFGYLTRSKNHKASPAASKDGGPQMMIGPSAGPAISAGLERLRGVDAPWAVRRAVELDRVAIGDSLGVSWQRQDGCRGERHAVQGSHHDLGRRPGDRPTALGASLCLKIHWRLQVRKHAHRPVVVLIGTASGVALRCWWINSRL